MNRVDFGKLIAALRREHEDEQAMPWSQQRLAQEANIAAGAELFNSGMISTIERGKRGLDQNALLALATALQLTSGERKEFFLAACGIDNERIARPGNDPAKVLSQLLDRVKQVHLPAQIIDSYYDTVAVNAAAIELFDLESVGVVPVGKDARPLPLNMMQFAFSDTGMKHLQRLMGDGWSNYLYQSVILFRAVSLRYRSTVRFQRLLSELNRFHLFRRYWREAYFEEEDFCLDSRHFNILSPKWGPVTFITTYLTAVTTAGEFHLCVYNPTSHEAADAFSQATTQATEGNSLRVDYSWPRKGESTAKFIVFDLPSYTV
jgi:transcriptional regulator with XRE-family HTH domain